MGCGSSNNKKDKQTVFYADVKQHDNSVVDSADIDVELQRNYVPQIHFISFTELKRAGSIPEYDMRNKLVIHDAIDFENSIVIFVSHQWSPTHSLTHLLTYSLTHSRLSINAPDTVDKKKYKLIVEAVDSIMKNLTTMKQCYLWIDYSCINQNKLSSDYQFIDKVLLKAIGCSDIFLTIICDDGNHDWKLPSICTNKLGPEYYKSDGLTNYWSRAWTRAEMLISANLALKASKPERLAMFKHGVSVSMKIGFRPHLLFSGRESVNRLIPVQLPHTPSSWFQQNNPSTGALSNNDDRKYIDSLQIAIFPHLRDLKSDKYEGKYKNLLVVKYMHGKGVYTYVNGCVYEGNLHNNKFSGKGRFSYTDGCVYDGFFKDDAFHGNGVFTYSNGCKYTGEFKDDLRHGKGVFVDAQDNLIFEGNFKEDIMYTSE
jgi:hypothetical protein